MFGLCKRCPGRNNPKVQEGPENSVLGFEVVVVLSLSQAWVNSQVVEHVTTA